MKVRLREGAQDSWLEPGAVYLVLSIYCEREGLGYRLLGVREPDTPGMHSAALFEVVDPSLTPRWRIGVSPDGDSFSMEPEAWMHEGFWNDLFDGDPAARQVFDEEYRLMLREHPRAAS